VISSPPKSALQGPSVGSRVAVLIERLRVCLAFGLGSPAFPCASNAAGRDKGCRSRHLHASCPKRLQPIRDHRGPRLWLQAGIVCGMLDVESVLSEYAKTMLQAQLFESALQVLAASELDRPDRELSSGESQQRTERFFSRGVWWIQRRLDMTPELAREIDALRTARNELAHEYLAQRPWLDREKAPSDAGCETDRLLPEHLRADAALIAAVVEEERIAEARAAVVELRALRSRFEDCVSMLSTRWFSGLGLREFPSWDELEQWLGETGWRRVDEV
jgi:hypothetical protein